LIATIAAVAVAVAAVIEVVVIAAFVSIDQDGDVWVLSVPAA